MLDGWLRLAAGASAALAIGACGDGAARLGDDVATVDAGVADPPDAATPATPDAGPPEPDAVRFVVMGDTGEGNEAQAAVAGAIRDKCAADGCDFVVLLGDNIYDTGVSSVDDPQWQDKFEIPYADIDLPFYVVLGNHDYGGSGLGTEVDKGPIEVEYSDASDKWTMPDTHYTFTWGNVGFIMLDTNSILWSNTTHGDQREWYATALAEVSNADWVFAAAHHPLRSNGSHGNAGSYESIEIGGIDIPIPIPFLDGAAVKSFYDELVCGTVDIAFAGHDHNRQWLDEPDALCGAELIVSGAGAKLTGLARTSNQTHFEDDTAEGFLYVRVVGDELTGQFIDKTGAVNFERKLQR